MKVLLLANGNSTHTEKWVLGLIKEGIEIYLFSLNEISPEIKAKEDSQQLYCYVVGQSISSQLEYLKFIPELKKAIGRFQPDVVHAHYATSYGFLAFLSGFRPYVVSVWGSDIMVFPNKSLIHKFLIKLVLKKASKVFCTSKIMHQIVREDFKQKKSIKIPFGVDTAFFRPSSEVLKEEGVSFLIVKSLYKIYGIDIAIKAFKMLKKEYPDHKIRLHIYGDGDCREEYELLSGKFLNEAIFFHGRIPQKEVPLVLNKGGVFINISRNESFGVSVLEASAVKLPIITSNRGGLVETAINGKTGIILKELNSVFCFEAMKEYLLNETLGKQHGEFGRQFVKDNYEWEDSIHQQIEEYNKLV